MTDFFGQSSIRSTANASSRPRKALTHHGNPFGRDESHTGRTSSIHPSRWEPQLAAMPPTISALKVSRVLISKSARPALLDTVAPLQASQLLRRHARFSSHSPMGSLSPSRKKVTLTSLRSLYKAGEPITMLTAHDFPSGHVGDSAGMEMILVGDSLAMVALGMEDTSEVLVEEMLLHCRSVSRAAKSAFTVSTPLPFARPN